MVKLIYFSIRDYTSKKYIPPHQHAFWEFIQYLDIYGKTVISDSTYEFQPNTISIIPPNTIHDERNYSGGKIIAGRSLYLKFNKEDAGRIFLQKNILQNPFGMLSFGYSDPHPSGRKQYFLPFSFCLDQRCHFIYRRIFYDGYRF